MLVNHALWESVDSFRAAYAHPDFVSALAACPSSALGQPHRLAKLAAPNLSAA